MSDLVEEIRNPGQGRATLPLYGSSRKGVESCGRHSMAPELSGRFSQDYCKERSSLTPDVIPAAEKSQLDLEHRLKCVLLGDGGVGKTSLVVSYTTNGYPTEYVPTAYDNYSVRIKVDDVPIRLQICDTAGQDDFDHLRPLCYPGTDVFLVCFSVVHPTSLCNVRDKWLPEIRKYLPKVPVVLVGTQVDLRNNLDVLVDLARFSAKPVAEEEAERFAKENGVSVYKECSALTQKNLKEVFDTALLKAIRYNEKKNKKSTKRKTKDSLRFDKAKQKRRKSSTWWRRYLCMS